MAAVLLIFLCFLLFGLVLVLCPEAVLRVYARFHGPGLRTRPRHIRTAGIIWLIVMMIVTYTELARAFGWTW